MSARAAQVAVFLDHSGWGQADQRKLQGDASLRRYTRLNQNGLSAMLMDAPPDTGEDVGPYLTIARHLADHGFSTPEILAENPPNGLLLIEDFGDLLFARLAAKDPTREAPLYAAAGEALGALHDLPLPVGLASYMPFMPDYAGLVFDWYAPELSHKRAALMDVLADLLPCAVDDRQVFVHRDFHAENLVWLPERAGIARVGLLDFQDAMAGPPDYDIASLVHDPRRMVTPEAKRAAFTAYLTRAGRDETTALRGLAICSAQRSLRILGVFARLCLRDGRRHYPDFIPRTWTALQGDLEHPALKPLRTLLKDLPEPTPARLDAIRAKAGQYAGQSQMDRYT